MRTSQAGDDRGNAPLGRASLMPKIVLEKIDAPFHALPEALDGYQILLITDVHAGLIFGSRLGRRG